MTDKELRAEVRNLRHHLAILVEHIAGFIRCIDAEMKLPSDLERGKRIAKLTNSLEMVKDQAKRYGLKLDFDGTPLKRQTAPAPTEAQ